MLKHPKTPYSLADKHLNELAKPLPLVHNFPCKSCKKLALQHLPGTTCMTCMACGKTYGPIPRRNPSYGDMLRCMVNSAEKEMRHLKL